MDDKIPDYGRRLEESWMDLCPELDLNSPAIVAEVAARRNAHNNAQAALFAADNNHVVLPWTNEMIQDIVISSLFFKSDGSDLYLHSRSFSRSKTKSDEYHGTSEQNNGSISSR